MPDNFDERAGASNQGDKGSDLPGRMASPNIVSIVPGGRGGLYENGYPLFPEKPFLLKGTTWFFHLDRKGNPKEQVSWVCEAGWADIFRIAGAAALPSCCGWTIKTSVARHFARSAVPDFGAGREVHAELDDLIGLDLIRHLFALDLIDGRKNWSLTPLGRDYLRRITLRDLGRF